MPESREGRDCILSPGTDVQLYIRVVHTGAAIPGIFLPRRTGKILIFRSRILQSCAYSLLRISHILFRGIVVLCIKWSILRISPFVNQAEEFDYRHKVAYYVYNSLSLVLLFKWNIRVSEDSLRSEIVIRAIGKRRIIRTKISRKCRIKFIFHARFRSRKNWFWNWLEIG